ncbi:DUF11 domain-containing protein [Nonomuraea sp. NPDC002799]
MNVPRGAGRLLAALLVVLAWGTVAAGPAQAATAEVTVHLYRVVELSCDEEFGEECGNDYYPKFEIDHQGLYDGRDDYCCAHGSDIRTNWVHRVTVDTSHNPVAIHMQLWDQDDLSLDDVVHWVKGKDYLDLSFDLNSCVFTSPELTARQGAGLPALMGESETTGADSARGFFSVTTPSCLDRTIGIDSDGDSITNAWETPGRGMDVNDDGTIDLALAEAPYHAVPYRKDLFVEVDSMRGTGPQAGVLDDVKRAFTNAPVDPYPDPADASKSKYRGIELHAAQDDETPQIPVVKFRTRGGTFLDDFYDLKSDYSMGRPPGQCPGFFGTAADRSSPNCVHILEAKRLVYRYMIFGLVHATDIHSSGEAEWDETTGNGGNDFIVTIPALSAGALTNVGGRRNAETSTFMHELGHTLGLGHGGGDFVNCKPNYLSVMNYTLQFVNFDRNRPLDYSSAVRGTAFATPLNENSLDESRGLYTTPTPNRDTVYGVGGRHQVDPAVNGSIDWNGVNGGNETGIPADINRIDSIEPADKYGCKGPRAGETLHGYDDWANLQYSPRLDTTFFADGAHANLPAELTDETILAMSQKADLKVTKTADRAEATGGDTIAYTVNVTNAGPGQAKDIEVTDTRPDGSVQRRTLPELDVNEVDTQQWTHQVPCDTADGTVLANSVAISGTDADGVPDPYTSDNTARVTTTVRAPALTVNTTATATVNAGEAITYTLTYANTGGGGASGVAVTGTLPAGVYYSAALDQGAGPRPDAVTLNADGTRTLVWNAGDVPARSGERTIVFTARPTLLATAGTAYEGVFSVAYRNAGAACTFDPVTGSARTSVTEVAPSRQPLLPAVWALRHDLRPAEALARVQATDTRFDDDADGALAPRESTDVLTLRVTQPRVLRGEVLATTLNLATRRINAATRVDTLLTRALGVATVGDAVRHAQATLAEPPTLANLVRYTNATLLLTQINSGLAERY